MAVNKRPRPGVDDVILMPVSPSRQRRARGLAVLAALIVAVLCLGSGLWLGQAGGVDDSHLNRQLHLKLADARDKLSDAQQNLQVYKAEAQVGEEARNKLREQIRDLNGQIAELKEAVAFYKNVMSPDSGKDAPLTVQKFEIKPADGVRRYSYRLILVQPGTNRGYLSGRVHLELKGSRDGTPVILNADNLLDGDSDLRFHFRYFQDLTGTFTVPEGVKPNSLEMVARTTGQHRAEVDKRVTW